MLNLSSMYKLKSVVFGFFQKYLYEAVSNSESLLVKNSSHQKYGNFHQFSSFMCRDVKYEVRLKTL